MERIVKLLHTHPALANHLFVMFGGWIKRLRTENPEAGFLTDAQMASVALQPWAPDKDFNDEWAKSNPATGPKH